MGVMELRKRPGLVNNVIDIFNKCQETGVDKNRGSLLENHGVGRDLLENPHLVYMGISVLRRRLKVGELGELF